MDESSMHSAIPENKRTFVSKNADRNVREKEGFKALLTQVKEAQQENTSPDLQAGGDAPVQAAAASNP